MTDTADIDALAEGLHEATCPRHFKALIPHSPESTGYEPCTQTAQALAATPPVAELLRKAAAYDSIREVSQDHWLDITRLAAVGRTVEGLRDSTTIEYDPSATDYPWCVDVGSGSKHGDGPDLPSAIRAALEGERS